MDNARVKAVTEAAAEVYGLGVDHSAMLLRGAVMSMYLGNRITRDELDWSEVMQAQAREAAETAGADRIPLAEVTGQLADETVLWLRQGAEKVPEPFGTVIQQAAEFLHDYWSEIIPAEI